MAFGRDGSELELSVLQLQVRVLENALRRISRSSREPSVTALAKKALEDFRELDRRLER